MPTAPRCSATAPSSRSARSTGGSPVADMAIAKYRAAGRLDREFGRRGKRTIDFAGGEDGAEAVAFQDGKILVGGWGQQASGPSDDDVALARLHPSGALDRGFGRRGKRLLGNLNGNQWVEGLSVLRSGRFVIALYADEDFALARFRANGTLDDDFGAGGFAIRNFGGAEYTKDLVRAGNRLYVIGIAGDDFAVAAFGASGRLLSGFGTGGLAIADFGGNDYAYAATLVGGRVVVAGLVDNQHFGLARFLVQ
ncbi:MAG TPA: hypothetical protein VG709_04715 [Actinomycetota bacterium]|nr:hypothetical protein [Actinomycetota bacterium]